MDLNVGKELAALNRMSVDALRARYAEVFGEPTNGRHKQWLVKRIIWRLQSLAEGDITERARRRAAELANDADIRRKAPTSPPAAPDAATRTRTCRLPTNSDRRVPIPGSVITRAYKGETLEVKVLADGFEYEGETYKSLSAVAKRITGSHCNGYHFFRLTKEGGAK
jgi:hypothetical protein